MDFSSFIIDYKQILLPDNQEYNYAVLKKNYNKLVKQNHPDLFPQSEKEKQNLILMEINAAYLSLFQNKKYHSDKTFEKNGAVKPSDANLVKHKEPDYALYKTAFTYYQKGQFIFNSSRYMLKNMKKGIDTDIDSILLTAKQAIYCYIHAYKYFLKIKYNYTESVWYDDSCKKITEIEKLSIRYEKIIQNIEDEIA